jgi:hypothetical protein
MTGQVKAALMEQQENAMKIEVPRTQIIDAWAFKGTVYCTIWSDDRPLRKKIMYRLIHRTLSDAAVEVLAANVEMAGSIDLFLWDLVARREPEAATRNDLIKEGKRTGICQVCHRKLTHPKSIAAGIGPVCAGRV